MVNSLGLKNTILESLSKNQLFCLKQETMYIAGWIETFNFTPPPPPTHTHTHHHLLWKALFVVFVVGTIQDYIQGVQNTVGVLKTKQRPPSIASWGGGEMKSPIFFNPPYFLFHSTTTETGML